MDNNKKIIDLEKFKKEKSEEIINEYIKQILELKGLEFNEENIKLFEYDSDFSDELKEKINDLNLLSLIEDVNGLISYNYSSKKVRLIFSSGIELEIFVDINSNLQTHVSN